MKSMMAAFGASQDLKRCNFSMCQLFNALMFLCFNVLTLQHFNVPVLTFLLLAFATPSLAATTPPLLNDPEVFAPAMAKRSQNQISAAKSWPIFHDFNFTERFSQTGIRFQHQVVDDAGKNYKPVHYDHGNGVAVADVDGDGLLDIYFTTQLGTNRLYRNLDRGKFEDITDVARVGLPDQIVVAASFADVDNDGLPDLFVTTVRHGNHLFKNLGKGRFEDIAHAAGLDYSGHSSGAVFFDYDNDGLLDLFLCNVGHYTTETIGRGGYYIGYTNGFSGHLFAGREEHCILYHNLGGNRFQDVTKAMGLADFVSWSGDATFTDLNQDGYPDLYVLNMQGDNHYFENQGGKRFVEKTAAYFPKTPWGAMGIKFFDFNNDGLVDLFVTDMHSDMTRLQTGISLRQFTPEFEKHKSESWCASENGDAFYQGMSNNIFGNAIYLNRGHGNFEEVSDRIGAETFWPWGVSVGDLNADGYEDVFIAAGMGYGFRYGINSVLLNQNGERFLDAEYVLGVEPRENGRTNKVAFILDASGADKDNPLSRGRTGKVPMMESLSSRSSVVFDLDNDGDLDIVTNDMDDRPQVLVSNLSERKKIHFLKIKLVGTKSNRDGLGTTVKVFTGGKTITQYYDGKSGHLSQSSMPLYFGLGDAASIDRIELLWPSGTKQIIDKDISANTVRTVKESAQ
jgi:enediyne biosynthesis protein E4